MDGVGQPEAIHAAGHLNVRKQQLDIRAGFKNGERLVGVHRFDSSEPRVLDDIHRAHSIISSSTTRTLAGTGGW
jgi:hypothetical protein